MKLVTRHWRIAIAFPVALAAWAGAKALGAQPGASVLLGYDAGAAAFLLTIGALLLFDGEDDVRRRAARDDENVGVIMALVVGAAFAGFAAAVVALQEGGKGGHDRSGWLVALAIGTLVESWLVVQALFAVHYAHRYFGDDDDDGHADRGIKFEGEPPRSYRDFIYVSVCMGATCQVSDFALTTGRFRNLVTVHALVAFAFNTLVLAFGVSIASSLLGQ